MKVCKPITKVMEKTLFKSVPPNGCNPCKDIMTNIAEEKPRDKARTARRVSESLE